MEVALAATWQAQWKAALQVVWSNLAYLNKREIYKELL